MSPWSALGWLLVVFVAIVIASLLFWPLLLLGAWLLDRWENYRRLRRRRREMAGRVSCSWMGCSQRASFRQRGRYVCTEHRASGVALPIGSTAQKGTK